jgi:steroid 5-alpha reductase family enzyme
LSYFLIRQRILSEKEDKRYTALETWLASYRRIGFFFLFSAQTLFAGLFLIAWLAALAARSEWVLLDSIGLVIALLAILGERLADSQLANHRAAPANRGKVMQSGLWRYSRHPNYFCEWLHWSAYIFFTAGTPFWWLGLLAPVLMYGFLVYATGIPHLEREAVKSRGAAYKSYQQTTNRFWPWKSQNHHASSH